MGKVIRDLKVGISEDLEAHLRQLAPDMTSFRILKQSVDARSRQQLHWVYTVEILSGSDDPAPPNMELDPLSAHPKIRPIIIGAGPAGLFAALRFVERGVPCLILERGSLAEKRLVKINRFWRYGEMDPQDNVGFGEGGAGLYSDGKLITRIKSPFIPYVMDRLIRFGAPEEIRYMANPHVGSDRIRRLIPVLRKYVQDRGGEFGFNQQVTGLKVKGGKIDGVITSTGDEFNSPLVMLATGHSAEDIYDLMAAEGVSLTGKSYAVGLRVEHPQEIINRVQFREHWNHPELGAANYKLTYSGELDGLSAYSFCMCPGGYVLSSSTESGTAVSNGMSNYRRNSPFANSAIVVPIDHKEHWPEDPWGGLKFRRRLEQLAYRKVTEAGGQQHLPAQSLLDFMFHRLRELPKNSSLSGAVPVRLDTLFPVGVTTHLQLAFEDFQHKMGHFLHPKATLLGVETRTSSPLRIDRDPETLESTSHPGLYPVGEGAGYAGGITSAACDGVKAAEKMMSKMVEAL